MKMPFCMAKFLTDEKESCLECYLALWHSPYVEQTLHFRCFIILSNVLFPTQIGLTVCQLVSGKPCHCLCRAQQNGGAHNWKVQTTEKSHTIFKTNSPKCQLSRAFKKLGTISTSCRELAATPSQLLGEALRKARPASPREKRRPRTLRAGRVLCTAHQQEHGVIRTRSTSVFLLLDLKSRLLWWIIWSIDKRRCNNIMTSLIHFIQLTCDFKKYLFSLFILHNT